MVVGGGEGVLGEAGRQFATTTNRRKPLIAHFDRREGEREKLKRRRTQQVKSVREREREREGVKSSCSLVPLLLTRRVSH